VSCVWACVCADTTRLPLASLIWLTVDKQHQRIIAPRPLPACSCRGGRDCRLHLLRYSPSSGAITHALVLDQPCCSGQGPAHLGELCDLAHVPSMPAGGGDRHAAYVKPCDHTMHGSGTPKLCAVLFAWHARVCCKV
jgi:hypothetical protein